MPAAPFDLYRRKRKAAARRDILARGYVVYTGGVLIRRDKNDNDIKTAVGGD